MPVEITSNAVCYTGVFDSVNKILDSLLSIYLANQVVEVLLRFGSIRELLDIQDYGMGIVLTEMNRSFGFVSTVAYGIRVLPILKVTGP